MPTPPGTTTSFLLCRLRARLCAPPDPVVDGGLLHFVLNEPWPDEGGER